MRVGILTFHFNYNYGAFLQAYASINALQRLGHVVEVVDYVPHYFRAEAHHLRGLGLRTGNWRTAVPRRLRDLRRRVRFNRMRRAYLPISEEIKDRDLGSLEDRYDAFFVGSDQVWNLHWMSSFDGFYFCDFVKKKQQKTRLLGFAPCFGSVNQPSDRLARATPLIRRFDAIGTRNMLSEEVLSRQVGVSSSRVCDPTLLHDFSEMASPFGTQSYILLYALASPDLVHAERVCREIKADRPDLPIWFVANDRMATVGWADRIITAADPADWVRLIRNAAVVVTDSFHGCIFAMKFDRTLHAYSSGWRSGRLEDLFRALMLFREKTAEGHFEWIVEANTRESAECRRRMALLAAAGEEWLRSNLAA